MSVQEPTYPVDHEDGCETPYCCGWHAFSGKPHNHDPQCHGAGPRFIGGAA